MRTSRKVILALLFLLTIIISDFTTSFPVYANNINNVIGLISAAKSGNAAEVKRFIDEGTDVNAVKNPNEAWTALHYASDRGQTEVVKVLLENGADANLKDKLDGGSTALIFAANKGYTEIVKLLLKHGADVNFKRGKDGQTALIFAANNNHIETVRAILESGADVNLKDNRLGWFALMYASNKGNSEIAKLLIDKGADVNLKDNAGMSSLNYALMKGHTETATLILERGVNINDKGSSHASPLIINAAANGYTEIVKILLEKGADVNAKDQKERSALMIAVGKGHIEVVKALLDKGADINDRDEHCITALMAAAHYGQLEIAKMLIDKGADVNAKSKNGKTALVEAEESKHTEIANILMAAMDLPEETVSDKPKVEPKNFTLEIKLVDEEVSAEADEELKKEAVNSNISKVIPSGGIAYLNFININGVLENYIFKSNFFVKFFKLLGKFFAEIDAGKAKGKKEKNDDPYTLSISFNHIERLLGYNTFLSIYYHEENSEPQILLSTALKNPTYFKQILDYLENEWKKIAEETKTEKDEIYITRKNMTYKDNYIEYLEIINKDDNNKNINIYFLVQNKIGHVSTDIDIIRKIVDISKGDSEDSIFNFAKFNKDKALRKDSRIFNAFFDFTKFGKMQEVEVVSDPCSVDKMELKDMLVFFRKMKQYKYLYADMNINNGLDLNAELVLDKENDEFIKSFDEKHGAPQKDPFINIIKNPPVMYLYYRASAKEYFDNFFKDDKKNKGGYAENLFKNLTSPSLSDEVLSHLDYGVAYVLSGIDVNASLFIPQPKAFIAFKIKDKDKFPIVYDKINTSIKSPEKAINPAADEYHGYKSSYVMLPPGICIGHAIVSDYYIIFSSLSAFKDAVDGIEAKDVPYFNREEQTTLNEYVYNDYNYFLYMNPKILLQQVPAVYEKLSGVYFGKMTPEQKESLQKIIKDSALPLIKTLDVFDGGITSGYYDKDAKRLLFKSHYSFKDLEFTPNDAWILVARGIDMAKKGERDEAIAEFKKAIALDPDYAPAHHNLGHAFSEAGEYDEAIKEFNNSLKIEPNNADTHYLIGEALFEMNKLNEAKKEFDKALELAQNNPFILNGVGYFYADKGINLDLAEEYLIKANKIRPNNAATLDSLGWLYYKKGDLKKALEFLIDANTREPGDAELMEHLADVYNASGDKGKALELYEKALEKSPGKKDKLTDKINELKQAE